MDVIQALMLNYRQGEKALLHFWIPVHHRSILVQFAITSPTAIADFRRIARAFAPATVERGSRRCTSRKFRVSWSMHMEASADNGDNVPWLCLSLQRTTDALL